MELMKFELFKIITRKAQLITFFIFVAGYVYASESYYKWYKSTSWERIAIFPHEVGTLLIGMLVVIAIAPVFTEEYNLMTDTIIICTKKGKQDIVSAKLIACCIFTLLASTAFFTLNIVINLAYGGLKGWDTIISSYYKYALGAFGMNMLEYSMAGFIISTLASICFAIFIIFLSVKNKSILNVLLIGGIMLIIPYFLSIKSKFFIIRIFKKLSYTELMRVDSFFSNYQAIKIAGLGINIIWLAIILLMVITVILAKKTYKIFVKHQILQN